MAIDALSENIFTLPQAPARAARLLGRRVAVSTIYRWAGCGVRGVRLETRFLGGVRYTSEEALQRFFDGVTLSADRNASAPARLDLSCRHRETTEANKRLADLGL